MIQVTLDDDEYQAIIRMRASEMRCPRCGGSGDEPYRSRKHAIVNGAACGLCGGRRCLKPTHKAHQLYTKRQDLQQALETVEAEIDALVKERP